MPIIVFTVMLRVLELAYQWIPAHKFYRSHVELLEKDDRISFIEYNFVQRVLRWISVFRWLYFICCLGFAVFIFYFLMGNHGLVLVVVKWFFALSALLVGLLGCFVIVPRLQSIFGRIDSISRLANARLPSFDLKNRVVMMPDHKRQVRFEDVMGFMAENSAKVDWEMLLLVTKDEGRLFLMNYPSDRKNKVFTMLGRIAKVGALTQIAIEAKK